MMHTAFVNWFDEIVEFSTPADEVAVLWVDDEDCISNGSSLSTTNNFCENKMNKPVGLPVTFKLLMK